jgi:hypothetical protein
MLKISNDNHEEPEKRKSNKSINKKKRRGQRHHVRDILRELKTTNGDDYYDYIDEIEK